MEAITKHYSTEEAVVLAVKAGNDVILMPPDEEIAITALNLAVYSGEISINRIDDATEFPHAMALGSANNFTYAYEMGKAISIESRLLGVHWNFAPVADINNNSFNPIINIRAFSENRYEVAKFIKAFINGAKEERTLTTVKHFPGHGNTTIDSHRDLPRINGSKNFLLKNELYPFIKSIESKVHSVMIGHLDVPSLEPVKGVPATLSESIVEHLLKKELGFDGLIVTLCLIFSMSAYLFCSIFSHLFAARIFLTLSSILLMLISPE